MLRRSLFLRPFFCPFVLLVNHNYRQMDRVEHHRLWPRAYIPTFIRNLAK